MAWSTSAAPVLAYDDYYPFGQYMDGRSYNAGSADLRYKFTEKERDSETGYDYFGARYYDARVGRFLTIDPHAGSYPESAPFIYAANNPMAVVDPTGMDSASTTNVGALVAASASFVTTKVLPPVLKGVSTTGIGLAAAGSFVATSFMWMATSLSGDAPPDALQTLQASDKASGEAAAERPQSAKEEGKSEQKTKPKEEAASEETAKAMRKQINRDLGEAVGRKFHDAKWGKDRTMQELKEDAKELYDRYGKQIPNWMKP